MLLRTSFCDILCYQILFALFQGKVIVFILFHQTSAHLYAKEKPQMSDSYLRLWMPVLWLFSSFTTDLTDWTDECSVSAGSKT